MHHLARLNPFGAGSSSPAGGNNKDKAKEGARQPHGETTATTTLNHTPKILKDVWSTTLPCSPLSPSASSKRLATDYDSPPDRSGRNRSNDIGEGGAGDVSGFDQEFHTMMSSNGADGSANDSRMSTNDNNSGTYSTPTSRFLDQHHSQQSIYRSPLSPSNQPLPQSSSIKSLNSKLSRSNKKAVISDSSPSSPGNQSRNGIFKSSSIADLRSASKSTTATGFGSPSNGSFSSSSFVKGGRGGGNKSRPFQEHEHSRSFTSNSFGGEHSMLGMGMSIEEEEITEEQGERGRGEKGEKKQRKRSGSLKDMVRAIGRRMSSGERDRPDFSHPPMPVPSLPNSLSLRSPHTNIHINTTNNYNFINPSNSATSRSSPIPLSASIASFSALTPEEQYSDQERSFGGAGLQEREADGERDSEAEGGNEFDLEDSIGVGFDGNDEEAGKMGIVGEGLVEKGVGIAAAAGNSSDKGVYGLGLKRGILRELQTPGSGHSVRFFSRPDIKEITPNTTMDASMSWADALDVESHTQTRGLSRNANDEEEETPLEGKEMDLEHVGLGKPSFLARLQSISGRRGEEGDLSGQGQGEEGQRSRSFAGSLKRDFIFPVGEESAHVSAIFGGQESSRARAGDTSARMNGSFHSVVDYSSMDMGAAMGSRMDDMSNLMDATSPLEILRHTGSQATLRATMMDSRYDESEVLSEPSYDGGKTPRATMDQRRGEQRQEQQRYRASDSPLAMVNMAQSRVSMLAAPASEEAGNNSHWSEDSSEEHHSRNSMDDDDVSIVSSQRSIGTVVIHERTISGPIRHKGSLAEVVQSNASLATIQLSRVGLSADDISMTSSDTTENPRNDEAVEEQEVTRGMSPSAASRVSLERGGEMAIENLEAPPDEPVNPATPARVERTVYLTPMSSLVDAVSRFSPMSDADSSPSRSGSSCHSPLDLSGALRSMADTVSAAQAEQVDMVIRSRDQYQTLCEKLKAKIVDLKDAGKKAQQEIVLLKAAVKESVSDVSDRSEKAQIVQEHFDSLENQIEASLNAAKWEYVEEETIASNNARSTADSALRAQLQQARIDLKDSAIRIEAMHREQMQLEDRAERWENKYSLAQRRAQDLESKSNEMASKARDQEIRLQTEAKAQDSKRDFEAELELLEQKMKLQAEAHTQREEHLMGKVGELEEIVERKEDEIASSLQAIAEAEDAYSVLQREHRQSIQEQHQIQSMVDMSQGAVNANQTSEIVHLQSQLDAMEENERRIQATAQDLRAEVETMRSKERLREEESQVAEARYQSLREELQFLEDAHNDQVGCHKREMRELRKMMDKQADSLAEKAESAESYQLDLTAALQRCAALEASKAESQTLRKSLEDELESLRRQNAELRQQSAAKDMKILQLSKTKEQLRDDKEMLNIALDSKQQEVELIKRRFSVKGASDATPGSARPVSHPSDVSTATPGFGRQSIAPNRLVNAQRLSGAFQTPAPVGRTQARPMSTATTSASTTTTKARVMPLGASGRDNLRSSPVKNTSPSKVRERPGSGSLTGPTALTRTEKRRSAESSLAGLPLAPTSFKPPRANSLDATPETAA